MKRFSLLVLWVGILVLCVFGSYRWTEAADARNRDAYEAMKTQRPRKATTPPAVVQQPAQKLGDGSFRKRVLLALVKHRTVERLQSEGVKGKKYTRAEAEAAYEKLSDEMIAGAIAEASPEIAAQVMAVGGPLTDFLDWLSSHGDQIMAIVKLIMSILALFA
jgi:hypothetical protein